jgi:small-conductance mechanosensitive channel/CRP-like cAMP-binding protein
MIKNIFKIAILPILVILFISSLLIGTKVFGKLILPVWALQSVLAFIKILMWLAGGWLFNRLLSLLFWDTLIHKITHVQPPKLLIQLSSILVLILTLSLIAHFVFNESLTTIIAAAGGLGFVLGFALQGLILDLFSGLAIQVDQPFKVGDFVNCHNRFGETIIGRVEETTWRTTRLWTTDRNLVVVPNSLMTNTILTNYSLPQSMSRFELEYTLDFSIPPDRAIRIFNSALLESIGPKGLLSSPSPKTIFTGVNSDGSVYKLKYFIDPIKVSPPKARNTINTNVMHHLSYAGITPSHERQDIFYEKMSRQKSWENKKDRMELLHNIDLFQEFSGELLEAITESFHLKKLKTDEVLISQGDDGESLFVLVEGLLEVSIQLEGKKKHLTLLRPGSFLGEMALLTGEKRSADVTSSIESLVGELTKSSIMTLAEKNPEVLEKMTAVVAKRRLKNKETLTKDQKENYEAIENEQKNLMERVSNFFFGK